MIGGTIGRQGSVWALLLVVIVAGSVLLIRLPRYDVTSNDVYFTYMEGQRLLAHENPYARVLAGNMRENDKYATYFPLFYLLAALTQKLGLQDYAQWIAAWRIIFLACTLGSACVIFWTFFRRKALLPGVFAALFWLFNRWTIHNTETATPDSIAILFLLLSLLVFDKHRLVSLLLFGVSLAFKQLAIILVPLYLIWTWQATERNQARQTVAGAFAIVAVPLILSVPFLLWNAEGFAKSIVFSITRDAAAHIDAASVGSALGLTGVPARLPMFLMLALVYLLAWRRTVGKYLACLLVMATFIDFNVVLFLQYFAWMAPFIPLAIVDFLDLREQRLAPFQAST